MSSQLMQFVFSGITSGIIYTLAAIGFTIIYNASGVVNFAQGEFIMVGGMTASSMSAFGMPLPLACIFAVLIVTIAGFLIEKMAIEPARDADTTSIIIITIGISMILRGIVQIVLGKENHSLPHFTSDQPFRIVGATILPQSLWILLISSLLVIGLGLFFGRTRMGKAMLAMSYNRLAAQLVGIDTRKVLTISFILSAVIGAIGGIIITPIATTSYDAGIMLGLKGFVAATLGGLGNGVGAIAGGLILGLIEALTAGYLSSSYKDAVPFVLVLLILIFRPRGLLGITQSDRV